MKALICAAAWAAIDRIFVLLIVIAARRRDAARRRQGIRTVQVAAAADAWTRHHGDVLPEAWLRYTTEAQH